MIKRKPVKMMIKILIIILILCLAACAVVAVINIYMIKTTENQIISVEDASQSKKSGDLNPDCILILGAMVRGDGTPSLILKERLDTGIELYNAGVSDKILMSGDNGQVEYNEVIAMRQYAIDNGIPQENIYLDYAGFSTYESMYRLRDVFQVKKAIVVTQRYHLYRALYIGNNMEMDVKGVAAADCYGDQKKRDIREIFARVKSFGLVLFNADPTYLGEPVSLEKPQNITE